MKKNALEFCEYPKLTLVMPVYNEGVRIIPTITTLAFTVDIPLKIIVVYDFDEDKTVSVIKKLQLSFPNIDLIKNNSKGIIGAITIGFQNNKSRVVGLWVSYHVDPFGLVNNMYKLVTDGCQLVSGNRFNKIKRISRGHSLKKLLSRAGNFVLLKIVKVPTGDITTSIKLFDKFFLDTIKFETKTKGGWALCTEITLKAAVMGVKLGEVEFKPENTNLINGVTNFKVLRQINQYIKWLYLGFKNRRIIRDNYKNSTNFIRFD